MTVAEEEKRPEFHDLELALEGGPEALRAFVEEVHPADLAAWLQEIEPDDAWRAFQACDVEKGAEVLQYASDSVRQEVLARMSVASIVQHVEAMPADEVVDVLALTDDRTTEAVLRQVDLERARGLRELAAHEPDTAGGLMTTEFVAVPEGTRVGDVIKEIKSEEGPAGAEEGVFVVDAEGRPVGAVSDRELLTSSIHDAIDEVMTTDFVPVHVGDDQEDVAHTVLKYGMWAAPVVDDAGRLVGVVSAEDVRDVLEDEAEEDIRRFVGTSPEEQTRLPVLTRVRHRLPLMVLTVAGGLVTARILDVALPDTGPAGGQVADVLRYLPIIIGLAGNVGIQSSTILVRAFATGEVAAEREAAVLGSEVLVGFLIGLLCGAVTTGLASWLEGAGSPELGFGSAVGSAIAVAVTWAAFLGCIVPMACRRIGIDPAIVAGPFLITLSDISGAAIFVGVAHLLLGLGGP